MIPADLLVFVFAGLFSPGPNVVMLTASGARFGFVPTVPHLVGVAAGVGITAGLTGLGLGAVLLAMPELAFALKLIAAAWILWLAFKLLRSTRATQVEAGARPFTFIEAVLFQWVNPKVWAVAIAASAFVVDAGPISAALTLAISFSVLNLGVCLFWTSTGHLLGRLMKHRTAWRIFMTGMAALMAASAMLIFL